MEIKFHVLIYKAYKLNTLLQILINNNKNTHKKLIRYIIQFQDNSSLQQEMMD